MFCTLFCSPLLSFWHTLKMLKNRHTLFMYLTLIHFECSDTVDLILSMLFSNDNSIHRKRSMIQIINDDQLCMVRAIGVGLAKHCVISNEAWKVTKEKHKDLSNVEILMYYRQISAHRFRHIAKQSREGQKQLALFLCRKANVPTNRPGCLNKLPAFEALHVRIAVIAASVGNKFIQVPTNNHEDWPLLYLYLVDHWDASRFHVITNIIGFFSANYFCDRCFKQVDHLKEHRCESVCLTCKNPVCPETDDMMSCRSCLMVCRSKECFDRY